jgi:hypothetical protein
MLHIRADVDIGMQGILKTGTDDTIIKKTIITL